MGFAAAHPGHLANRAGLDRLDRLQRLGRVAEVLEVAAEDARLLDRLEHALAPPRRCARAAWCTGWPCRLGGERDGLLVQEVGDADDHDVGVRVLDGGLHVRGRLRDVPALLERRAALRTARVDDADAVATALRVEGHGIEVADQPGAKQGDVVLLHRAAILGGAPAIEARPQRETAGCTLRLSELFQLRHPGRARPEVLRQLWDAARGSLPELRDGDRRRPEVLCQLRHGAGRRRCNHQRTTASAERSRWCPPQIR